MGTQEVQDLLNLAMKTRNYSFKCSKIQSNLVTICLISEQIFPVLTPNSFTRNRIPPMLSCTYTMCLLFNIAIWLNLELKK
jgi:hypothetical protein